MKTLNVPAASHRPRAGEHRVARVVGMQLAALLLAVVVNPPAAALGDTHAKSAPMPAPSAAPERNN